MTGSLRTVGGHLELDVTATADLVVSVAASADHNPQSETITATLDGAPVPWIEIAAPGGTRLHRIRDVEPGHFVFDYSATIGRAPAPAPVSDWDVVEFTRPSRYCDSDRLSALAVNHFDDLTGWDLVQSVRSWVLTNITYAPGSTDSADGALEAYLSRRGVCRDSAHLVITFLRARGMPARLVSVYAPGLRPMDFHAVAEVAVDGQWWVVDGTGLASRGSMARIATGRDAADTAFLTVLSGRTTLTGVRASAQIDVLPGDDGFAPTQIG